MKEKISHLDWLESEAIHIMREVAGQCANPVLLFSGGKDSLCLLRIAEKAFRPGRFPFPLMHIDTGHNYPEVINFRDKKANELGERLIVSSLEDSMKKGTIVLKQDDESREISTSRLLCLRQLKSMSLIAALVGQDVMKKKPEQKNVL